MHTIEKDTYYAILIAMLILIVIIFSFLGSVIRQHRRYRLLYKEKIKAEITTLENERKRLAEDLHDELGPALSGVKLKLAAIDNLSPTDKATVNSVLQHVDKMVEQIRTISYGLMPPALEQKGALFAIAIYIKYIKNTTGLIIHFQHNDIRLPFNQELHVYRILLEIIHNTVKHAAASQLIIHLSVNNHLLLVQTKDDGVGFKPKKIAKSNNGLGLANLQSRVDILNGTLRLSANPGNGTRYTIEIPVNDTKN